MPAALEDDPFDSIIHFEDTIYSDAYALGERDGAVNGSTEGRLFGLEKGFDKFSEIGRLHGRALVLLARLSSKDSSPSVAKDFQSHHSQNATSTASGATDGAAPEVEIIPLRAHERLVKHIRALVALTDPATLSTANTDEAVNVFDDRLLRAVARAQIIERITSENLGVGARGAAATEVWAAGSQAKTPANAGEGESEEILKSTFTRFDLENSPSSTCKLHEEAVTLRLDLLDSKDSEPGGSKTYFELSVPNQSLRLITGMAF